MSYEFPVDPDSLFEERAQAFIDLGVPAEEVTRLRATITDMWADSPGGWTYEWSQYAARCAAEGEHYRGALAYGGAKFPCLADPAKALALTHQLEQYTLAVPAFSVAFDRRVVPTRYRDGNVDVPVHVLSSPGSGADTPVLIASGGLDTWKMDLHQLFTALALGAHVRVVGFEHAGVGELTSTPMAADTGQIIDGLIEFARTLTTGRVEHLGLSFGGYFSARSGLRGDVDGAIVLGGPVTSASFGPESARRLLYGMDDIFGNAVGFTTKPHIDDLLAASQSFALDEMLSSDQNSPMLVINGDADIHVPTADTSVFAGRRRTEATLIPAGSHCAFNKLDQVIPIITKWAAQTLHP
jgi:esterase FrsA